MDGGLGHAGLSKLWTVKYGSVVSSINTWLSTANSSFTGRPFSYVHDGGTDGINEAGLGAHLLYLGVTQYGPQSSEESVSYVRVVRYLLDTCASVSEAVQAMRGIRVASPVVEESSGKRLSLGTHVAVEDAAGDSAVFEIMDGELQVYHGRNYTVITNDPALPDQIANLKRYQPFTRMTVPPGDIASMSRFVRLAYFLNYVPKTTDSTVMTAEMRGIISTAASPLGAPAGDDPELGVYPTWWTSLIDYSERVYYWGWVMNPNFVWVDMEALQASGKLNAGSATLHLNPRQKSLVGEVSELFKPIPDDSALFLWLPMHSTDAVPLASSGCLLFLVAAAVVGWRSPCAKRLEDVPSARLLPEIA